LFPHLYIFAPEKSERFLKRLSLFYVGDSLMVDVKELEKMFDVIVEKIEETEEKLVVYVSKAHIGKVIGPSGSVVRSAELVLGTSIEVRGI